MAPSGVFKVFNWTWNAYPSDADALLKAALGRTNIIRVRYQSELSPTTSMPHLQGYFVVKHLCAKATAFAYMPTHINMTAANFFTSGASKGIAWFEAYTSKPESFDPGAAISTSWGSTCAADEVEHKANCQKGQGVRTDLNFMGNWLRQGRDFKDLVDLAYSDGDGNETAMRMIMINGLQNRMATATSIHKRRKGADLTLECIWLYGVSGTGKTKYAHDLAAERGQSLFTCPDSNGNNMFFDGLAGQDIYLIDDFDGSGMKFKRLLKFCDVYPGAELPIKGASVYMTAKTIIITSSVHPRLIYSNMNDAQGKLLQLYRRFDSSKKLCSRVKRGEPDGIRELLGETDSEDSEKGSCSYVFDETSPFGPGGQFE